MSVVTINTLSFSATLHGTPTDRNYADRQVYGGNATLSLGARNLFDREAQKTGMIAGVVSQIQSPLGRMIYARVNLSMLVLELG